MLQYGVHKLGLLCNKLFPPEVPATVSVQVKVCICGPQNSELLWNKVFPQRVPATVSVHGVVHMCASFKPVHLNSYRPVTTVTSTCRSFPAD